MNRNRPSPLEPVVPEPSERHPVSRYLATLSPQSRRIMRGALDVLAGEVTDGAASLMTCPWPELRHEHARWIRTRLLERYKPASVNVHIAALRSVLKHCYWLGLMAADDYQRAIDIGHIRLAGRKRGLDTDELHRLFTSLDDDPAPLAIRDAALLSALYGAGLRRSEVVALRLCDYDGQAVSIDGERSKKRVVPLSSTVRDRMEAWLCLRGRRQGPLFFRLNKSGRVVPKGLTPSAVFVICQKRAAAAGIDRFSPQDLRRSFMVDLLAAGSDVVAVKRLVGHETANATSRYVDR